MSDLPLNSVENTRDNTTQSIDGNSNITKSPYKLSMTEKRVIDGLQKLTDLLFKPYYKQNTDEDNENEVDGNFQSDEVTMSSDVDAPTNAKKLCIDEENDENILQFSDKGAEKFCAMVVNQMARSTDEVAQADEWHRGQLNAYDTAQQYFFG